MSKNDSVTYRKDSIGGVLKQFLIVLLTFILGGVFTILTLACLGVYYIMRVPVSTYIQNITEDENYSQYLSEEYAKKSIFQLLGDALDLAGAAANGTLTVGDVTAISPVVENGVNDLLSSLESEYGIRIEKDGFNGASFQTVGNFVMESVRAISLGEVLSSPAVNVLVESNENYELLMAFCYGSAEDYDIVDGKVVMKEGKTAATLGSLMEGGIASSLNNVSLASLLSLNGDSQKVALALAYGEEEVDYTINAETKEIERVEGGKAPTTIGDLVNDNSLIDDTLNVLKIGDLVDMTGASKLMQSIATWTIADLKDESKLMGLKIGDIIDTTGSSKLMTALSGYTLAQISDGSAMNTIRIGDLIDIDPNNKLLNAIAATSVSGLDAKISSLKIGDIFTIDESSDPVLRCLKDATINNLETKMASLTIEKVFASDIYEDDGAGNQVLKGTWKYILSDGTNQPHKISEFSALVSNMTTNIQAASLNDLKADGVITMDTETLEATIKYFEPMEHYKDKDGNNKTKIGQLTITQLIDYTGKILTFVPGV